MEIIHSEEYKDIQEVRDSHVKYLIETRKLSFDQALEDARIQRLNKMLLDAYIRSPIKMQASKHEASLLSLDK